MGRALHVETRLDAVGVHMSGDREKVRGYNFGCVSGL